MGSIKNTECKELLVAQAHIWNHIYNFINSMSLKSAVELGIPDVIHRHGKPMTLSELIIELQINESKTRCLYRLMRILIHSGFFTVEKTTSSSSSSEEEAYTLTPACKLLLKNEPMSVSPFLLAMLNPYLTNTWYQLSVWFRNDDPSPFVTTHGKMFWDLSDQQPTIHNFFNEAMASDARLISRVMIEDVKHVFEGINSFVDVGGGIGVMSKAIVDAFPNLKCTVLDLPQVVDGLDAYNNLNFVGGDMFEHIPPADAIILKWILHDWNDEECVKILKNCKEAIPCKEKGGKILIIDMVVNDNIQNKIATETQLFFDMLMMVTMKGTERTEQEWANLISNAGLTGYKITPSFGLRSLIEAYY